MKRRRAFGILAVVAVLVVLVSFAAWGVDRWAYPPNEILASAVSPDGRYRCVVSELPPQGPFMASPYTQLAWIENARTGGPVGGVPFDSYSDSASCDDARLEWSQAAECKVTSYCFVATGRAGQRGQSWTMVHPPR